MQPIIGITTAIDNTGEMYHARRISYIPPEYAEVVRRFGGQPVLLEPHIDPQVAAQLCDGIIISGGQDIDPALYGQTSRFDDYKADRQRTDWERQLIDACDTFERPVLGVCYGMQLLNVHYGGTLCQDLKSERGTQQFHGSPSSHVLHDVTLDADFLGYKKGQKAHGTHIHHQAVETLAPGFTPVGYAEDRTVEAMVGHGHYGIQWHAEMDDTAKAIYGAFIERCHAPATAQKTAPSLKPKSLSRFLFRFGKI